MLPVFVLAFLQTIGATDITSLLTAGYPGRDKFNVAKNVDDWLANHEVNEEIVAEIERGGAVDKIVLTRRAEYTEVHRLPGAPQAGPWRVRQRDRRQGSLGRDKNHHSLVETSYGKEDEQHPTTSMLQTLPQEASKYHDHTGNNPLDKLDLPVVIIGRDAPEPADDNRVIDMNSELDGQRESREEERPRETEAEESREEERHREMESASNFSYHSMGISAAGIISIFSGYLGDQTGHAHTIALKICIFFMLATFASGAGMRVMIHFNFRSHISIICFRKLKCLTSVFWTLSVCSASIFFLKMYAIFAFVPALSLVLIPLIMALHPCSHH